MSSPSRPDRHAIRRTSHDQHPRHRIVVLMTLVGDPQVPPGEDRVDHCSRARTAVYESLCGQGRAVGAVRASASGQLRRVAGSRRVPPACPTAGDRRHLGVGADRPPDARWGRRDDVAAPSGTRSAQAATRAADEYGALRRGARADKLAGSERRAAGRRGPSCQDQLPLPAAISSPLPSAFRP
jgi:hypothetical protein